MEFLTVLKINSVQLYLTQRNEGREVFNHHPHPRDFQHSFTSLEDTRGHPAVDGATRLQRTTREFIFSLKFRIGTPKKTQTMHTKKDGNIYDHATTTSDIENDWLSQTGNSLSLPLRITIYARPAFRGSDSLQFNFWPFGKMD